MFEPLACLIPLGRHASWLHGDHRGSVNRKRNRVILTVMLCLISSCRPQVATSAGPSKANPAASNPVAAAEEKQPPSNYQLALDFIHWIETRYVATMKVVDGRSTDVTDLVKELGEAKTVERYGEIRRLQLDYAKAHPQGEPSLEDLTKIAEASLKHVLANTRTSRKWIDYDSAKLRRGVIDAYKKEAAVWIVFYRKLLAASPPADADSKTLIRSALSRDEYERAVRQVLAGTKLFYASLKNGVAWYAPWGPWVRGAIDSSYQKDEAMWLETIEAIYGKGEP